MKSIFFNQYLSNDERDILSEIERLEKEDVSGIPGLHAVSAVRDEPTAEGGTAVPTVWTE
jgi:hypothetical protein